MAEFAVRVEESATCRRTLVATLGFAPGQKILEESPYAYTLRDNQRETYCDFCLKECSTLTKCSSCEYVSYCSTSCETDDRARCHDQDCEALKSRNGSEENLDMRLLLSQIIRKLKKNLVPSPQGNDCFPTAVVDQLESHHEKLCSDLPKEEFERLLKQFIEEGVLADIELSTLWKVYGATCCNSLTICDNDIDAIADGIYLRASMANHSCAPNCEVVYDGRTLYIRTIKDIKEGEECTISYIDVMDPVKERQANLKERYHFTCKCVKCVDEIKASGLADDCLGEELRDLKKSSEQIQDAVKSKDWAKVLQLCEPYLKPMDPSSSLAYHYLLVKLRGRVFEVCMHTQNWEKAAEIGQLIKEPFKEHYGPYSAKLGMYFLTMGDILLYLKRHAEAREYLTEAKRVLNITHGPQHPLMLTKVQVLHAQLQ